LSDYLCARSSPDPTTRSLPAPTNPASAHGSSPVQIPPTPDNKLPLTLPSLCVSLSSAYPFSACSNRQPFVSKSTKGYAYLFPVSTLFDYSSSAEHEFLVPLRDCQTSNSQANIRSLAGR